MSTFAVNQDLSMVKVATLYHLGISRAGHIYKCSISKRVTQTLNQGLTGVSKEVELFSSVSLLKTIGVIHSREVGKLTFCL